MSSRVEAPQSNTNGAILRLTWGIPSVTREMIRCAGSREARMAAAVELTRNDHTATDLRREAARSRDSDAARRMLALALVQEGQSRTDAARSCGMDRQTLRDWVHRYNESGLDGLSDK